MRYSDYESFLLLNLTSERKKNSRIDKIFDSSGIKNICNNLRRWIFKSVSKYKKPSYDISLKSIFFFLGLSLAFFIGALILFLSVVLVISATYEDIAGSIVSYLFVILFQYVYLVLFRVIFKHCKSKYELLSGTVKVLSIGFIIVDSIVALRVSSTCSETIFRYMNNIHADIPSIPENYILYFGDAASIYYLEPFVKVIYAVGVLGTLYLIFRELKKWMDYVSGKVYNQHRGYNRTSKILSLILVGIIFLAIGCSIGLDNNSSNKAVENEAQDIKIGFDNMNIGDSLAKSGSKTQNVNLNISCPKFFDIALLSLRDTVKPTYNNSSVVISLSCCTNESKINGQDVTYSVLGYNGKIVGIVVTNPSPKTVLNNYQALKGVYENKYGDFSRRKRFAQFHENGSLKISIYKLNDSVKDFKNAYISINIFGIIYVDRSFKNFVLKSLECKRIELQKREMEQELIQKNKELMQKREDSIRKVEDSIRKVKEYNKMLETI